MIKNKVLFVGIFYFLLLSACELSSVDETNSTIPNIKNVETTQKLSPPPTGTNFTRKNQFIDSSLDQVDDYANQLNQQMNELDNLR